MVHALQPYIICLHCALLYNYLSFLYYSQSSISFQEENGGDEYDYGDDFEVSRIDLIILHNFVYEYNKQKQCI